ncbi:MAG: SUMF1/EgtB/PvdO family nonheme iron enzyme [Chloroflexi bacterium]|nr:SUMF1/EgtB/PvdO family nonheme iron enzyme [Chloroflexota bacterium]
MCNSLEAELGHTTTVGRYSPAGDSVYGAADMAGNVWEWCLTKWRESYQDSAEDNDPEEVVGRVLRGGAFQFLCYFVRPWYRIEAYPSVRKLYGFRVMCTPLL